jgi:hypothetical protein
MTELNSEVAELRRAMGWEETVLAREWLDLAVAGEGMYGPIPQEVRIWVIDGEPFAWSFHHMHLVPQPKGMPPAADELAELRRMAGEVCSAFRSRLVAADFARDTSGRWWFIEAGPGSCAGTAHESVFKAVARRLRGDDVRLFGDEVGGVL